MMGKKTCMKTKISSTSTLNNSNYDHHQNDQFKAVVDQKSIQNTVTPPPSPLRQRTNGVFSGYAKHFEGIQYVDEEAGISASSTLTPPLTPLPTPPLTRIKSTPLPPPKTSSDKQHPNSVDEHQELISRGVLNPSSEPWWNYEGRNCKSKMANSHPEHQSTLPNSLGNSQGGLPVLPRGAAQKFPPWSRFVQQYQHPNATIQYERIMPCIWSCRMCSFKCNSGNELVEHNQAYQHWDSNGLNLPTAEQGETNIDTNSKDERDSDAFSNTNSMDTGFLVETAQIINMGTSEVVEEMIYQQVEPHVQVSNWIIPKFSNSLFTIESHSVVSQCTKNTV